MQWFWRWLALHQPPSTVDLDAIEARRLYDQRMQRQGEQLKREVEAGRTVLRREVLAARRATGLDLH